MKWTRANLRTRLVTLWRLKRFGETDKFLLRHSRRIFCKVLYLHDLLYFEFLWITNYKYSVQTTDLEIAPWPFVSSRKNLIFPLISWNVNLILECTVYNFCLRIDTNTWIVRIVCGKHDTNIETFCSFRFFRSQYLIIYLQDIRIYYVVEINN